MSVEQAKRNFLQTYNPHRNQNIALSLAIKVSVQRNPTYSEQAPLGPVRKQIRSFWRDRLIQYAQNDETFDGPEGFTASILNLKNQMNEQFLGYFNENFRISHAQKSLSVYLKHLWCMGEGAEPPLCPVDGVILNYASMGQPRISWTQIDQIDEYQAAIAVLRNKCTADNQYNDPPLRLAEWELVHFNGQP